MTDREEREEHIKRLEAALACEEKQFLGKCSKQTCDDNCALLYEQGNWGEWKETLRYAINSLKTDLKYDLLYEETSGQADNQADKPIPKMTWDKDGACPICGYFRQWNDDAFCGHCGVKLGEVEE